MKKIGLITIVLLLLCIFACGCAKEQEHAESGINSMPPPSKNIPERFESYEELKEWFSNEGDRIPDALNEVDKWGEEYEKFVYGVLDGSYQLVRPYIGDEYFTEGSKEDIALYKEDPVGLPRPSIRFDSDYGSIRVFYLTDQEIELAKSKSIHEFLEQIAPYYGSLHVLEKDKIIEKLRVEEIQLKDRVVEARVAKWKSNGNMRLVFVYDDMLINLSWMAEYPIDMLKEFHLEIE